jgi:predicted phage terminase large subunit-like protein
MGYALTDADLAAMLRDPLGSMRDLDKIDAEISLSNFIRLAWPQIEPFRPYQHNWHIDAISAHLEAVSHDEIRRLIINVPPGTSKSLSTSVFFPAWEWGPRGLPGLRYIGTSYSERFALRDNGRMRALVQSEWFQERWPVTLTKEGEKKFENTDFGFREAIPFKSLTSGRADRLLIDDPHSTESAESDAERLKTQRVFLESVPTRLNDPEKSAIIIIMQRLHEDDVTGLALSRDLGYEHLMLPMHYDPQRHCVTRWFEDPRKKAGELIDPKRFPPHVVEEYRISLGEYGTAGQLEQAPVPRGGGIFKWHWWQLWGNEDDPNDPVFKRFPAMDYIVASLDSAYTEKEENDFSALTIWGIFKDAVPTPGSAGVTRVSPHWADKNAPSPSEVIRRRQAGMPKLMLMNAWQDRLPLHELVDKVAKTCTRFKVDRLLIENKASGISVAQEIRRLHSGYGWGVQLVDPGRTDKIARAYSVQHLFADNMVYAPDRDWADMVKNQMANFPKTTYKDLTDSSTQALRHLRDIGLAAHGFEIEQDLNDQMAYKSAVSKPLYPV